MSDQRLDLDKLRAAASAIYIAVPEEVARDIAELFLGAVKEIESLRAQLAKVRRFHDGHDCRMVNGEPADLPKCETCDHGNYSWTECSACNNEVLGQILEEKG